MEKYYGPVRRRIVSCRGNSVHSGEMGWLLASQAESMMVVAENGAEDEGFDRKFVRSHSNKYEDGEVDGHHIDKPGVQQQQLSRFVIESRI